MKLHFGLLAVMAAVPVLDEALLYVDKVEKSQAVAIENGIPVMNPTKLALTKLQLDDLRKVQQQLAAKLRVKLALLIPQDIACHYQPAPYSFCGWPEDLCWELCHALETRCDLVGVRMVGNRMVPEDLEWVSRTLQQQLGIATLLLHAPSRLIEKFRPSIRRERAADFEKKRQQVRDLSDMLDRTASNAIETAWLNLFGTRDRLQLAERILEVRDTRRNQLRGMNELGKPMPLEEIEAELDWYLERGRVIERTNELNQAIADWLAETGRMPCR